MKYKDLAHHNAQQAPQEPSKEKDKGEEEPMKDKEGTSFHGKRVHSSHSSSSLASSTSSNSSVSSTSISPTHTISSSTPFQQASYHQASYHQPPSPSTSSTSITPPHLHSSGSSGSMKVIKGKLQKKGMWTGWTDAYFHLTDGGMLFEFKHENSSKPVRVMHLSECTVQLAENLTGKPYSFVMANPKQEDLFLRAFDETKMVEWVSSIGRHCLSAAVQWGTDAFLEALVDAVVISSEDGTILGVNNKMCEMFGYEKHELMGRCVDVLTPPAIQAVHANYMKNYINTGEKKLIGKPRNVPVVHKSGDIFRAILSLGEKKGEDGERRFIATLRQETSFSQEKIKETIVSSLDLNLDSFGSTLKNAVMLQLGDVFDTLEQLRVKNKQLAAQLAVAERHNEKFSSSMENTLTLPLNLENITIHEKLAATGGSGATVFSCSVDGFRCVMKELHIDESLGSDIDSFMAEILLLEKLPYHKNVVRYLFHTRSETTLRLFMEQYTGSLSKLIARKAGEGSTFSQREVARFFLDMVNGIEVLHGLKILHRDIKSDNIFYMLGPDGSVTHLVIGDLDTAKIVSYNKNTSTVVGTPGYMAPEVLQGIKYSHEVDIWSIGMIVYELMTLQRPYSNSSIFQVAQLVVKGELPPLSENEKRKFKGIIPLWEDCVKSDPTQRPSPDTLKTALFKLVQM
eukprot:Phypoly_transcript_04330.p1 GENE.Phypoly_transcript_04330~~Phypoly_transcript_04330.p1  ORF type:complete len:683 (+),score=138.92 Phypoly_transcript_04330:105-2153(+)